MKEEGNLLLFNGKITTLDPKQPEVSAILISKGLVAAIGSDFEIKALSDKNTIQIDLRKQRVIPGLNDSHIHLIRGGLNYNMELRWDGVPSLAYALKILKEQVRRTPPPQWVRVIGGWSEFQFAEKRMPTLHNHQCCNHKKSSLKRLLHTQFLCHAREKSMHGITNFSSRLYAKQVKRL